MGIGGMQALNLLDGQSIIFGRFNFHVLTAGIRDMVHYSQELVTALESISLTTQCKHA